MTESINKVKSLLDVVKRPGKEKSKPSNFALWWAWTFYNAVALLFDVIAAGTVYSLMGNLAYAVLTFATGFLPLLMHEFLYTRAYANRWQKILAVIGAGLSVCTILLVGVLAGLVNIVGITADNLTLEIALIITLVLVSGAHGLIAAVYFYIDDGIKSTQVRAESMAYHERMLEDISRAKEILALAEQSLDEQDKLASQHGAVVLNEILGQLRGEALEGADSAKLEPVKVQANRQAAKPYQVSPLANSPEEMEAAELQQVPLFLGLSKNGNGHKPQ